MSIGLAIGTHLGRVGGAGKAIAYLLRDLFTTDRAAGTVGGTNAEPGPGTRAVLDASSKLSLAGGVATFASGAGSVLGYSPNINRTHSSGWVLYFPSVTPTVGGPYMMIGWSAAVSPTSNIQLGFTMPYGPRVAAVENGTQLGYSMLPATQNVAYDYMLISRQLGAWFFWRVPGGAWRWFWHATSQALVPDGATYVNFYSGGGHTLGSGVAMYQGTWLPSPIASDSFDRTGSDLGLTDGGGHEEAQRVDTVGGAGGAGSAWTAQLGTWQTAGGLAQPSALAGGIAVATVDTRRATYVFDVGVNRSAGVAGVVVRWVDANNHVRVYYDGTNLKVDKVLGGVVTNVKTSALTYAAGARLIVAVGFSETASNIGVWYNTNSVGSVSDYPYNVIADAALQSSTVAGLYSTDLTTTFDDCAAWPYTYGGGAAPFASPLTPPAPLTITNLVPFEAVGGNGTSANIPVAGTYSGGGTVSIEGRFNGGSWATLATGVASGWSGTLAAQPYGSGSVEVRIVGQTSGAAVHHIRATDVFIALGQSNISGRGANNQVVANVVRTASMLGNDGVWKPLTDPTDRASGQYGESQLDNVSNDATQSGTGGVPGGSYLPLLAQQYLTSRAYAPAFIPRPLGGSQIASWQPGANHQDRTTLYGSAVYWAKQVKGVVRAVLWHQGESEASTSFGLTSNAYYAGQLASLGDAVFADLGCPLVAARIHLWTTGGIVTDATHVGYVNGGINATIGTHHVVAGPDLSSPNWTSNLHGSTDAEMSDAATRWYNALVAAGL